jgi:hypothetical protein
MSRPKTPVERTENKNKQPSVPNRKRRTEDHERTIPGRRTPEPERKRDRIVNEDEQLKAVNNREDNAQSQPAGLEHEPEVQSSPENIRLEAPDDNSEVNPRLRKVN